MKKHQATKALKSRFVPEFLGFPHIEREVIESHTRPLAKELFTRTMTENPAILVLDGTYIYVQKSGNFSFSRRSYSLHKHRPLVKLMLVVTTTGYIVSVLGPYLADSKNSDANILNHMIRPNAEQMKEWVREGDIFVVDRGFRDSGEILNDLGITMEMPTFLPKGATQLQTKDANCSSRKLKVLARSSNELQTLIIDQGLDRRSYKWTPLDASEACPLFPQLSEDEIRELTLGVYQVKLARSYTQEHCSHDGSYDILVNSDVPMILSAKIQSRHISAKSYKLWIKYSCSIVEGWYCTCKNGSRVVGMCAHITSVIWYLSYMRHEASPFKGIPNWADTIEDASRIPTIDESDSDDPEE
ncbi:uncharacterized protein LOC128172028 [Crassostrea angulata]|uniref:uncharacterized protein LOC128172028 n=1 Tax=Magallana angulata TaxID=2784310 RepID=UPI0022B1404F|nr:uncharacterized protein LOC128172028 [Crassostrea angulata]